MWPIIVYNAYSLVRLEILPTVNKTKLEDIQNFVAFQVLQVLIDRDVSRLSLREGLGSGNGQQQPPP